jgi:hypothetical protein
MPAPAAAGAVVGVVGRLAGKKGAQAAAGAAAKEGAEEAVEGGAKAVAGKVQQGLGMVQANQQQAQQKRQNMQQRLQDATREGASTGSTIGKAMDAAWDLLKQQTFNDYFGIKDQWISLPKEGMDQRPELYGEVADAMNIAYAPIGGHAKYGNADDLSAEDKHSRYDMLDYDEDPHVDAAKIYSSTPHGFKASLTAHDGSLDSKKRTVAYTENMLRTPGHYAEMSGPWFRVMERSGLKPLTDMSQIQQVLAGKNIQPSSDVEGGYVRNIGGVDHTKQIYGKPITNEGHVYVDNLMQQMSPTEPLPVNFESQGFQFGKAVGVVKAQQTLDAFDREKIEEAINPKSNTIIIASKPGSAEGMGSAQQSYLHNQLLAHLANLGKRAPNMNMITGVGHSKEWGNEHSITLSNVPHDLVDDIKELAHQFKQDSILHSPEGTTDALFAPPRGEATAGLRNPSLTQNTPSDYTQYPLGMNLTYADYFEKAVLVKERKSPEAMRHKREYDKKYESSPERVKYREDLNRERRRRGIYGSGDHMDVSHTEGGGLTLESQHANRGRHFKERGTLRPIAKSLREDLELLRNLLAGPMDEQDKKIGLAMVGMLEERHENDDEEKEEEKPKPKQTGFLSTLLR